MLPSFATSRAQAFLVVGVAVGGAGSIASVAAGARMLHSDDGLHVLSGFLYGAPVALFLGAIVAGFGDRSRPVISGIVASEGGWALLGAVLLLLTQRSPVPAAGVLLLLFVSGHLFPIVPVAGALGGLIGGRLGRRHQRG
ncbi:MAG: hypothetical protein ACR2MO_08710 [Acidimicrobiales bacterium]